MAYTDPPKASFRLSQLIYDTRYRSMTIQVVTLAMVVLGIWWLVYNASVNLKVLGITPSLDFLWARAGYDIGFTLIPYDSTMSYGRSALVGICNTLLIAGLGCITATLVGVTAGVLRLSKNWVVSRLMGVYVEAVRNVPLVLWILLVFAVLSEGTPAPRAFKPDASGVAEASMMAFDSLAFTNRGVYAPAPVLGDGAGWLGLVFLLSLVAAWAYRKLAKHLLFDTGRLLPMIWPALAIAVVPTIFTYLVWANFGLGLIYFLIGVAWISAVVVVYRVVANAIPSELGKVLAFFAGLIVAYFVVWFGTLAFLVAKLTIFSGASEPGSVASWSPPVMFSYPTLGGFNFTGGMNIPNSLIALWVALTFYTGAFIAENVRAGIMAVSKGQSEAAFALGLQPNRTMNLVILPQAMRVIIPPMISQFLNLTKNSSLAIAVSYPDIRATLGGITLNQTGRALECMLLLGLFYLVLSLMISAVMNRVNNRMKLKER